MRIVTSAEVREITLLLPVGLTDTNAILGALHAALTLRIGRVRIDLIARTATCGARRVPLTPREFALLACLVRRRGERVTRADLLADIWGQAGPPGSNHVEVHLSRLRAKLADAQAGVAIATVREGGWRIDAAPSP